MRGGAEETLELVLDLFRVMRGDCASGRTLSGAVLLLMDAPNEGLMPMLVNRRLATVAALRERGVGILPVEQKVDAELRVADRVAVIENGRIVREATPAELFAEPDILLRSVGVRAIDRPSVCAGPADLTESGPSQAIRGRTVRDSGPEGRP